MSHTLASLVILVMLAGSPPSGGVPRELDEIPPEPPPRGIPAPGICARGDHLLEDGGQDALILAHRLFETVVRDHPEEACGHAGLSRALVSISLRRIEEDDALIDRSVEAARRAIALAPESANAHAALAGALLLDLRPEEADAASRVAIDLDPESVPALQAAAWTRMGRGRLDAAQEAIEKALTLRPDLPASYHTLGNVHLMAGRRDEAFDAYEGALTLLPGYLPSSLQMGAAFEEIGAYARAGAIFERLIGEHPEVKARAELLMGFSLMKREGWKEALSVLDRVEFKTRRGLSNGTVLYLEGLCYEQLDRAEEALAAFRRVIDEYPDATAGYATPERLMFPAFEGLARLHLKARETEKAVAVLEEGLAHEDASPAILLRLARFYVDYGMPDRAIAVLRKAASREVTPRTARRQVAAFLMWARLAAASGDRAMADDMARQLMSQLPALDAIGDYLYDLDAMRALSIAGHGPEAVAWLRKAVTHGYGQFAWMDADPELDNLRAAPGFREIAGAIEK